MIFIAKYLFILSVLISGIYFLFQPWARKKQILILAIPSLVLTYILAQIAGHLYYDPRPFVVDHFTPLIPHDPDNGFPSDHALLVFALAMIGSYLNKKLGIVLWIIAVLVAIARVYVGVHHPIDVVGSMIIAVVSTAGVYFALKRLRRSNV